MAPPLSNSFEGGSNGTTLTGGSGGNTAGGSGNYVDTVSIGTGCTLAFSSTAAAHGSLSCKIATGATSAASFLTWQASLGTVTTHYGRAYIYLSAAPGNSDAFIQFQTSSSAWAGGIQLTTSRQLLIQIASYATLGTLATTLATNTWYRVEWKLISGTATGTITVSLYAGDSTTAIETYASPQSNFGANCGAVLIGWTGSHPNQAAVYVDDIGLSLTGFLGPATATLTGAGGLSGAGTLTGAGAFGGAAGLSGLGALTGAGTATGFGGGGALTGLGILGGTPTGTFVSTPVMAGSGTLTGIWIGTLAQTADLSGNGSLALSGYVISEPSPLSGNGTLSVLQATGGLVFASPGVSVPQAHAGTSQVAVAPPGTSAWRWLGTVGHVTALTYSFVMPGGADKMTATVAVPASYRSQLFWPGWQVKICRGGHIVWTGRLDEPVGGAGGWTLTAVGDGNRGQDFTARYTSTWPNSQPDESVNNAIGRGLPWANTGVGVPATAWYGQLIDSGAQTVTALLNLICTRGALAWYVNSQPGGLPGSDLAVFPLPTIPNRLLTCTTPVARTLSGDINTIVIRYQATPDTSSSGGQAATYAETTVTSAASVATHGTTETYIDLSDVGVMSQSAAQAVGNNVLAIYKRASFAGPFVGHYGQLMNLGGTAIDPGTDQAGTVCKLILTDYGYGGEVVPGPVQIITGGYQWDDFAKVFTITPYQGLDLSLTGLLSAAHTALAPIKADIGA